MSRFLAASLAFCLLAVPLAAQQKETRTYAGGFSSRWKTIGLHGHDQPPCAEPRTIEFGGGFLIDYPDCDPVDFERANLDNSIGLRAGREHDFVALGRLKLVGGAEASMNFTEYNITQTDFALIDGSLTAGADLAIGSARIGIRYGGGPFVGTDGHLGLHSFHEIVGSIPLRSGTSVRLSRRDGNHSHTYSNGNLNRMNIRAAETSIMLVGGTGDGGPTPWEFATVAGTTNPGRGPGPGLGLRSSAYHQMSASRDLSRHDLSAYVNWTASAHESKLPGIYRGYPGNYRSKTIESFGLGVRQELRFTPRLSMNYGAGIEVADWRDEYDLLMRSSGTPVVGGIEAGVVINAAGRVGIGRGMALELRGEQVYWSSIRLGEARWGVGLVFTR